jgi:hypothetical protein
MATKLGVYNGALNEVGERQIASLTESTEARRVLDLVYTDVVNECLEEGSWNFATETVQLDADTGVTPSFGFTKVFAKPTDWKRTVAISSDEYLASPLLHYYDDVSYLSAEDDPIYLRYVSNDTGMGFELTRWPQKFTRYVELALADRVCLRLNQDKGIRDRIERRLMRAKRSALSTDAMNEANPKFMPEGSWNRSRSVTSARGDRGSSNRLTG